MDRDEQERRWHGVRACEIGVRLVFLGISCYAFQRLAPAPYLWRAARGTRHAADITG